MSLTDAGAYIAQLCLNAQDRQVIESYPDMTLGHDSVLDTGNPLRIFSDSMLGPDSMLEAGKSLRILPRPKAKAIKALRTLP